VISSQKANVGQILHFFLFFFFAQIKRIHCKEKQEQQTLKARGASPLARNLN
jgi:hypothetical protein